MPAPERNSFSNVCEVLVWRRRVLTLVPGVIALCAGCHHVVGDVLTSIAPRDQVLCGALQQASGPFGDSRQLR